MEYKRLYIAYGSNINLEQMAHRCPNSSLSMIKRPMNLPSFLLVIQISNLLAFTFYCCYHTIFIVQTIQN